jgi:hypothetical protein
MPRWLSLDVSADLYAISHDVWNQTPADNLAWLTEFKRESGFF